MKSKMQIFVLGGVLAAGACWGAVTLTDGAALEVGTGETCTVTGTHTIPNFVNNGTLVLAEGASLTLEASVATSSVMAVNAPHTGSLTIESGATLTARTNCGNANSFEALAFSVMGGTGTVTVAAGGTLRVPEPGHLRMIRNSNADRTPLSYTTFNLYGTLDAFYTETSAFCPTTTTDTNRYHRVCEINLHTGGVFRSTSLVANDGAITRVNLCGGTFAFSAATASYFGGGFNALWELNFVDGTTNTFETAGDVTIATYQRNNLFGSGTLVKKGTGTLTLYRPANYGFNAFTGDIRVEAGSVYLGRALAVGQQVYVCKGASYSMAVPDDASHITYEDESERPAGTGLYTVNADVAGDIDLTTTAYDHDRLGGPVNANVTAVVGGTVTHAAVTTASPFTLVGQNASSTLDLSNSGLEASPLLFTGAGVFKFAGDRDLTADDRPQLQFAGGTYWKNGTVSFLGPNSAPFVHENGTLKASNIFVGADGTNGMLVVRNGSLVATDELDVGSNRGTERFHTTGTLVLSNALATATSLRLAKTSMTNGTTVGRCYGRIELQQGGRICANTLQNDEGYSEFVFNGGAYMPAGGGSGTFGINQTGQIRLVATNGNDITLHLDNTTNFLGWTYGASSAIQLTGDGGFRKTGRGVLTFNDMPTTLVLDYTGDTTFEGGLVRIARSDLSFGGVGKGDLVLKSASALDLNGHTLTVNNLTTTEANALYNGASAQAELDVGADGADFTFASDIPANVTLGKVGAGAMTIRGDVPHGVKVKAGTVRLAQKATYAHYRFRVEKVYGKSANSMQIAEFKLLCDGADVTRPYQSVSSATGGASSPGAEKPVKAVDGDLATKFLDFNGSNVAAKVAAVTDAQACWLQLDYAAPVTVTHYTWAYANDCFSISDPLCRNPQNWRLQGSADGATWEDLDVQMGYVGVGAAMKTWIPFLYSVGSVVTNDAAVDVTAGASLALGAGTYAFGSLTAEGAVTLDADACVKLAAGGAVQGNIGGAGTILVDNGGTASVSVGETFTGRVAVTNGTAALTHGIVSKWFRFTVRKVGSTSDKVMQLSEFKLFDVAGMRQGTNLTMVANGTAAEKLQPGTFCTPQYYPHGGNATKGYESPDKMFDGNTATKWCATQVTNLVNGTGDWRTFTLRLPDDAKPIASFTLTTANDRVDRCPVSWLLETSADGKVWRTVDDRTNATVPATYLTDYEIYPLVRQMGVVPATVEVGPNGTVELPEAETQIAKLRIDCAAGAGTFTRLNLAANGVLELVNLDALGVANVLPLTATAVANGANAKTWTVKVNGVEKKGWKFVVTAENRLMLVRGGTCLFIR